MTLESITIVATADPFARTTWSGTPLALAEAMQSLGAHVEGMTPIVARRRDAAVATAINMPRYGLCGRQFRDYFGRRVLRHREMMDQYVEMHPDHNYLHTNYLWLPHTGPGGRHFLFRDTGFEALADAYRMPGSLRNRIRREFQSVPQAVEHVFATSLWAKHELMADGYDLRRVSVVGSGIGSAFGSVDEKPAQAYRTGRTLVVTRVRFRQKGLDLLLAAHELARQKRSRLTLDVVAPPGVVSPRPGVRIHHDLSLPELLALYRQAALYAMPARYEPWGLVYLEAHATGTPTLGSARCAYPELALDGRAGIVVNELTPSAIAESLVRAHDDPELLSAMGAAGREHVLTSVSWEKTALRILDSIYAQKGQH